MKVITIVRDPSTEEIARTLEQEFSPKYSYSFFGLGENKTVIVRKSEFIGAQISKSGNQITVHGQSPNVLLSLIDPLLGISAIGSIFHSPLKKLEADLIIFLKSKYSV